MRIAFVSTHPPLECGIGTYTQYLRGALDAAGHDTFVVGPVGSAGRNVIAAWGAADATTFAPLALDVLTRITPDVVHLQHEYGLFGPDRGAEAVDLALRLQLNGVPVVTTLHTVTDPVPEDEALPLRPLLGASTAVIVHEQDQHDALVARFGAGALPAVHVIEHGVREVRAVPGAKALLGLEGRQAVLMCGYYRPTKGFEKALDFFPAVAERCPEAVLVLAGKTRNLAFDEYRRGLLARFEHAPFADRLMVLRGQFPQHTFDTIVSAADVVVLPYDQGGASGILSQCFAFERPVVTSGLPAFRAVIGRSGGGIVCDDDTGYADAIVEALDPATAQRLRADIAAYVTGQAGWSRVAAAHAEVYEQVGTGRGPGRYVHIPDPEVS